MARWLGVTTAAEATPASPTPDENYREKIRSWEKSGKLLHAADLVGSALILNCFDDEQTNQAAQFILKNEKRVSVSLLEVTQSYLRLSKKEPFPLPEIIIPEESKRFFSVIAGLKKRIREYPRNPILWMDLAFYYSAIGQTRAAEHAVTIALSLNSENRYLLRSGARFYMHVGTPDKALHFLRRSAVGNYDPPLIS
jgi:tetratricopeptide (TPR) repeat protein